MYNVKHTKSYRKHLGFGDNSRRRTTSDAASRVKAADLAATPHEPPPDVLTPDEVVRHIRQFFDSELP
jgi:hypothetical protein